MWYTSYIILSIITMGFWFVKWSNYTVCLRSEKRAAVYIHIKVSLKYKKCILYKMLLSPMQHDHTICIITELNAYKNKTFLMSQKNKPKGVSFFFFLDNLISHGLSISTVLHTKTK